MSAAARAASAALEQRDGRTELVVTASAVDLEAAWDAVRAQMSREAVAQLGEREGFRIEDVLKVVVAAPSPDAARAWMKRRLPRECAIEARPDEATSLSVRVGRRGQSGLTQRAAYARDGEGGRIRVEALEFHVAEHCNLRCAHCCNMSPFVAERFLSLAEVERMAAQAAASFDCDVFKIMGGEPLLHPDITAVLRILKAARVSPIIRLFTNGLLLHRMDEAFWEALDQLTVSVYSSAPVKPEHLARVREQARRFDVVLNVKPVESFSQVLRRDRVADDDAVRATYAACWLRHRCMIVRDGVFYKCTRAAYKDDFMERVAQTPCAERAASDGVPVDAPDFNARVLDYLNREEPLSACRYCYGGDGPVEPHVQLRKKDVAAGRLSPAEGDEGT